jgi:Xaa-Pro aminopeptidase
MTSGAELAVRPPQAPAGLHGTAFPLEEYDRRVAAVRRKMAEIGADVLLVDCVEHMAYLFGYVPPAAIYQPALLPLEGDPVVIVRKLDTATFAEQSWVEDHVVFQDGDDPVVVLAATCREKGWDASFIAAELDSHFLTVARFRAIEQALPKARFLNFSRIIWEVRLIKSELEIACLRRAADIADRALAAAVKTAGVGVPERECAAALYAEALRAGADNGRSALMASGKRSDSLHGRLGSHQLESGDILHVESVPLYQGYGARLMRSTVIGSCDAETTGTAETLIELQDRQFAAMLPGAPAGDVDRILRDGVLSAGLRDSYDNFTGYTLGYIGLPKTSDFTRAFLRNSDWTLEAGMVFHMYTYARGLAFSDTILITDAGPERLTQTPRRLFVR